MCLIVYRGREVVRACRFWSCMGSQSEHYVRSMWLCEVSDVYVAVCAVLRDVVAIARTVVAWCLLDHKKFGFRGIYLGDM